MATYSQLSYGSSGREVVELQRLLQQNGYDLNVDGQYGAKTRQAVMDYQKKNSLDVDGIVGENTWGALTKPATSTTTTTETNTGGFEYADYKPSDAVAQAEALLQQQLANKPGVYQSSWQTQLNETLDKILNREKFSYDLNGDALYQQYKDQYTTQGKMAMMDTMGQAAALTGGYGNSYAQSVGQQAYQGYLQQLNDKVPELYQLALNQYNREGDEMYNQAALMAQMEDQDYGRYRDSVSDYYTELDRLYNQYNTERDYDYSKWADGRNFDFQTEQELWDRSQWQQEFEEAKRQYDQQYELQKKSASSSKSTTSYTPKKDPNPNPDPDPDPEPKPEDNGGMATTYGGVIDEINDFIAGGSSKSKVKAQLRDYYKAGVISQAEYKLLVERYAPAGYTY